MSKKHNKTKVNWVAKLAKDYGLTEARVREALRIIVEPVSKAAK